MLNFLVYNLLWISFYVFIEKKLWIFFNMKINYWYSSVYFSKNFLKKTYQFFFFLLQQTLISFRSKLRFDPAGVLFWDFRRKPDCVFGWGIFFLTLTSHAHA